MKKFALFLAIALIATSACNKGTERPKKPHPILKPRYQIDVASILTTQEEENSKPSGLAVSPIRPVDGIPLPEGAELKELEDDLELYTIVASLDQVVEFYKEHGFDVKRVPGGAVVKGNSQTTLQILTTPSRQLRLLFLKKHPKPQLKTQKQTKEPKTKPVSSRYDLKKLHESVTEAMRQGKRDIGKLIPPELQ